MNIKKIATATLLPAAITGIGLSSVAVAEAASGQTGRHVQAKLAGQHKQRATHGKTRKWVSVRHGDTLSRIGAAHHMTWQAIYATPPNFRHLASPDLLTVGQRLRIPANPKRREAEFAARFAAMQPRVPAAAQPSATQVPSPAQGSQPQTGTGQTGTGQAPASQVPVSQAPAAQAPAVTQTSPAGGTSSFQQCVALHESGNNPTASSSGLYGILPSTWSSLGYSGTAGQASVAQQNAAFSKLYAQQGTQPWAPYDGC
jgi:hypothetical protein